MRRNTTLVGAPNWTVLEKMSAGRWACALTQSTSREGSTRRLPHRQQDRGPGRPRHVPIVLSEPQLLPMTDQEREVAVSALSHLLCRWLGDARAPPQTGRAGDMRGGG